MIAEIPWLEDMKEAKVPLVPGMLVVDDGWFESARICDTCPSSGHHDAAPDLRDRATFLLCLDELAKRVRKHRYRIGGCCWEEFYREDADEDDGESPEDLWGWRLVWRAGYVDDYPELESHAFVWRDDCPLDPIAALARALRLGGQERR